MPDRVHAPSIRVEADRPAGDLDRSLGLTRPVEVDRQRTAVDLHRHEPQSRAERDVVAPGAGIERDRGDVDMSHVDGGRRRAAVEADRPRHARVELDVCLEMQRLEDPEIVAPLVDPDRASRAVVVHGGRGARVLEVRTVQIGPDAGAARQRHRRRAGVDLEGCLGEIPGRCCRVEGVGRGWIRADRHVSGGADYRDEDDERRGDVAGETVDRAADDELEADHDQDDRPQVDELVEAIDRYLPGVDEQRDDASEDEDRGPEEAAVAVRVAHYRALMFTRSAPPETVTS
ncbi:MAG: hypothetical protein E6I17_07445 [Chloroflexi bacterium]|nr:MAG: hypothetical protein E6I17_07445 [Chloroflexota bacterium]